MQEFVAFLAGQPPFDALAPAELERLAAGLEVEFVGAGDRVEPRGRPWLIRAGAVELRDGDRVVDLLVVGDVVDLDGAAGPTVAVAVEDTLGYRLPATVAGSRLGPGSGGLSLAAIGGPPSGVGAAGPGQGLQPVARFARPVIRCSAATPIAEAARLVSEAGQSCVLVELPDGALGIVTDHDLRRRVATGEVPVGAPVGGLASAPVLSYDDRGDVAGALLAMVERGVHHLVLADAGRPSGVVRLVDLASAEVRDPMLVRRAVDSARTVEALVQAASGIPRTAVELHDAGLPADRIAALLAAVTEAAVRRATALLPPPGPAGLRSSWLLLGSIARREQLPGSDLDTALVWLDRGDALDDLDERAGAPAEGPADDGARLRAHAAEVLDALGRAGLARCPEGVNADSPRFCRSFADWRAAADDWVHGMQAEDALLLSTLLTDSRPVTDPGLGEQVSRMLLEAPRPPQYLHALLGYTLAARPPTGFVRDFVVEHSGEHRGELDLKRGGLRPLTALARWVAVTSGDTGGGTVDRLRRGAAAGLLSEQESEDLVGAFELVFALVTSGEVEALRADRPISTYLAPAELDRVTRRALREAFRAIGKVQDRLGSGFSSPIAGLPPGLR